MKKLILLSLAGLFLSSCSSYFKRQECDATNWFDYGQNVALEGRRLTGDQFINECEKADADVNGSDLDRGFKSGLEKYCQPETVFQIAKNGNFFSPEMCIGENLTVLRARHKAGVLEYCQKSNGFAAGAKGKAYNKICPIDMEPAFIPEFNRGRKRYISTEISENEKEIGTLDRDIAKLQTDIRYKSAQLQNLQMISNEKDPNASGTISNARVQLNNLEYAKRTKETAVVNLREQNRKLKLELVQLD